MMTGVGCIRYLYLLPGHPALHGLTNRLSLSSLTCLPCTSYRSKHTLSLAHQHYSHLTRCTAIQRHTSLPITVPPVLAFDETPRQGIHLGSCRRQQADKHFILSPKGLLQASPSSWKPYLNLIRLDRPIGTWLLFLPCTWSISLAAAPGCLPDPTMLTLFALGSFFMRGAGCTINDMWDKDFDSKVSRTRDRPLACGQISYFQALSFLGLQLSVALGILLTMNWNTVLLGTCAMIPVIIYPLMKRVTYWPQIFLGLTFNWGAIMGWSAIHGSSDLAVCLPLYASGIAWTLVYDTIYAHQDKDDDILIGVKSTALGLGEQTKPWLLGFGTVMIGGLTSVGMLCDQTWPYYLGVAGVAAHVAHQILTVNLNNGDDCAKKFRSNRNLGIMFWMAIMFANLIKTDQKEPDENID